MFQMILPRVIEGPCHQTSLIDALENIFQRGSISRTTKFVTITFHNYVVALPRNVHVLRGHVLDHDDGLHCLDHWPPPQTLDVQQPSMPFVHDPKVQCNLWERYLHPKSTVSCTISLVRTALSIVFGIPTAAETSGALGRWRSCHRVVEGFSLIV